MNKKTTLKILVLSLATALGGALTASAQTAANPPSTDAGSPAYQNDSYGLLGERYAGLDYSYTHLHDSGFNNLNGFAWRYNQALQPGFDFGLGYEWARSDEFAGMRARQQEITASVTTFTQLNGMKPFLEPGVGWSWSKAGSAKDNSFIAFLGTGVELQIMRPWVVTPYVRFVRATGYNTSTWDFGIKSAYRLSRSWGLNVDLSTDDSQNTGFTAGVNYHF